MYTIYSYLNQLDELAKTIKTMSTPDNMAVTTQKMYTPPNKDLDSVDGIVLGLHEVIFPESPTNKVKLLRVETDYDSPMAQYSFVAKYQDIERSITASLPQTLFTWAKMLTIINTFTGTFVARDKILETQRGFNVYYLGTNLWENDSMPFSTFAMFIGGRLIGLRTRSRALRSWLSLDFYWDRIRLYMDTAFKTWADDQAK